MSGKKSAVEGTEMTTINPYVDGFLTIYSQSERSTGGTRGYSPETYVETKLDHNLIPRILDPKTKLVFLRSR